MLEINFTDANLVIKNLFTNFLKNFYIFFLIKFFFFIIFGQKSCIFALSNYFFMYNNNNSLLHSIPPATKNIIIVNVILWLMSVTLPRFTGIRLEEYLGLHYWQASGFNPVQFISYMFMHATFDEKGQIVFAHLFFNMFGVFMFGRVLEYTWGAKRFLIYYMVTGIGAGIVQQLAWTVEYTSLINAMNQGIAENSGQALLPFESILQRLFTFSGDLQSLGAIDISQIKSLFVNHLLTVGASGSVFALLLAFGMLFPNQPLYLFFIPVPIKAKYFVIGYAVIELVLGVGNFSFDNIAHFAHLGGMIFGYFLIVYWRKHQFR